MKKDENIDWLSKDNSTFKMVNGVPVMIDSNKSSPNYGFKAKSEMTIGIIFIIMVLVAIVAGFIFFSNSVSKSNEESRANQIKKEQLASAAPASSPTVWKEGQLQEMVESFNKMQSSNNYSPLYDGRTVEKLPNGADKLIVYVTDKFTLLSENEKKLYVEQNFKLWAGMTGSRQVKMNYDFFEIEMLRKGTIKRLATWDSLLGISIK